MSALDGRAAEPRPGLRLAECGLRGQITLRAGDLASSALVGAVEAITGVAVPEALSAGFAGDDRGAVWMAPDELLLFVPHAEVAGAVEMLEGALAGTHHMALDVSHARAVLRLEGADAAETLAKGAPLDFSEAGFPVGRARRTHLGGLAVGIWRRGPEEWELVCFRSFAHHLFAWLETSGVEGAEVGRFGV
ncbi:sarcosine oxidase subunit gamma family protein [Paralimibaculum aggregatum]|uniref:Sarcosine oxidase subunit gamma family protein n=1 Tax=Paralimibaculum aggregatum TaxID=3036245 RepID=A0ABQ6LJ45_9RHOB|nr:sarcosine oxidase subunit gamma family protein [Limibaculum sp. NKW23]